jgi:FOG: PKD repeat
LLNDDFTLNSESIAVDSGTMLGSDMMGYSADIGAFEYTKNSSFPAANFIANETRGAAPLNVQFVCANHGISWQWDFDGNGTIDAISKNPVLLILKLFLHYVICLDIILCLGYETLKTNNCIV